MPHIALVAPHFLENTNRYIAGFAHLPGVKLSLISADAEAQLPPSLRKLIAGHYQVRDVGDAAQLGGAAKVLSRHIGRVDRLTGALEQLQMPIAEARALAGVPGMKPHLARRFRDKDVMKEVLRGHGVPVAASALVTSEKELHDFVGRVGLPIIIKPQAGVGSRGTHRIESEEDLKALSKVGLTPTKDSPLQAEQFIRAREFTCEAVTIHGNPVWRSGTRYFPSPLEVLETPWVQYCVLMPREVEAPWTEFAPINTDALKALFGGETTEAATALTHMEWFLRDDGKMFVSEVGARPPGVQIMALNSLVHEADFIGKWAKLVSFDTWEDPGPRKWAAGAAFLRGQGTGNRIVSVQGVEAAREQAGDALVEMKPPKPGQPRLGGYEGEGIALVKAKTTEGAKQALLAVIQNVQVRYG